MRRLSSVITASRAREMAQGVLAEALPRRWAHVQGVAGKAESVSAALALSGDSLHAMAAGPLAASQPGFTIADPLAATFLGLSLFGEHIRTGILDLAGEALALALLIASVSALSHSHLITGEDGSPSSRPEEPRRRWRAKAGPNAAGHLQMPVDGAGHLRNYSGPRTTADDAKR